MKLKREIVTNWNPRLASMDDLAPDVNLGIQMDDGVAVPDGGVQIYGLRMLDMDDGTSTIYVLTEVDRKALVEQLTGVLPVSSAIEIPQGVGRG